MHSGSNHVAKSLVQAYWTLSRTGNGNLIGVTMVQLPEKRIFTRSSMGEADILTAQILRASLVPNQKQRQTNLMKSHHQ